MRAGAASQTPPDRDIAGRIGLRRPAKTWPVLCKTCAPRSARCRKQCGGKRSPLCWCGRSLWINWPCSWAVEAKPRSRGPSRFDRPIPRSGTPDRLARAGSWAEIGFAPAAIYLCLKQLFRSNRLNAKWLRRSNTASKTKCLRVNSCGYGFRP